MPNRVMGVLILLLGVALGGEPAARENRADKARACELIKQARAAIGGETAIQNVLTLSTSGRTRRHIRYLSIQSPKKAVEKERKLDGRVDLDFAFPDKFRQRVKSETLRGFGYSYAEIINGEEAWRDPPLRPMSSNRDSRVIDVGDVQRTELRVAQGARQQLTFYVFGWFLQALPSFPLKYKYEGQEKNGDATVDVISVEGKGGFIFLLLLDASTHEPLALAAPFYDARTPNILVEAAGYFDRRFMMETYAFARKERQARTRPPIRRELQLRFSDHQTVAGLRLPHQITALVDGEVEEEVLFDEIRINRPVNLKKFAGPTARKE
jgi:hypothetical protein